jgi:hypothetical protein
MKTYSVSKVKQLIDLNGDSVNFEINFRVSSHNKEPFDILVVDQSTLDSDPDLQYKSVTNGTISGKVRKDKNVYENHFIILKANSPCECDVEIEKTELPQFIPQETTGGNSMGQGSMGGGANIPSGYPGHNMMTRASVPSLPMRSSSGQEANTDKNDGFHWIKIVLVIGFIVGIGFVLYWVSQKNDLTSIITGKEQQSQLAREPAPILQLPPAPRVTRPAPVMAPSPAPVMTRPPPIVSLNAMASVPVRAPVRSSSSSSSAVSDRGVRNQLLSKLKGLNIN